MTETSITLWKIHSVMIHASIIMGYFWWFKIKCMTVFAASDFGVFVMGS